MMRCAQKWPRLVYFRRTDNTLPIFRTISGEEIVTWSTAKHAIAGHATTPLPVLGMPDEWSRMRRASIAEDSWLVGEQASESEWWDWWE